MLRSVGGNLRALKARSLGACIALALVGGALTGSSALAATPDTPFGAVTVKPIGIEGSWGERMAAAKYDYNGDGAGDVFVSDYSDKRVYLLSGKQIGRPSTETNPLRIFRDPSANARTGSGFGSFISAFGDVTGDGKPDLAVGAPLATVPGGDNPNPYVGPGTVYIFDGATGKLVRRIDNPPSEFLSNFGARLGSAGDITGDNKPELLVGASGEDEPANCNQRSPSPDPCYPNLGKAYVFNGATGEHLRTYQKPAADLPGCKSYCQFGLAVQSPGDVDGDGVSDQLVGEPYYNRLQGRSYLFSGKTGELIRRIDSPEPESNQAFFGFQDAAPLAPGDVNGDGHADVYQASFDQDGPAGKSQGRAWVFSGKLLAEGDPDTPETTPLYALDDPTPEAGGQFGWSMDTADYDKDGTPDLYIGQSPHHVADSSAQGGTYVMNGADGSLLKALELPESCEQLSSRQNRGPALGWSLAAPGDLNGDGEPDFVAGAPFFDIPQGNADSSWSKTNQGMVFSFVSNPGPLPTPCTAEDLGSGD